MAIFATTINIYGSNNNIPKVYTNNITPVGVGSNIEINSDVVVSGNMLSTKRMDVSKTVFAMFRPSSNISYNGSNELHALSNGSNLFTMDMTSTDMTGMNEMGVEIPFNNIFDENTGIIRAPISGFYNLCMQGSFSNSSAGSNQLLNGVYYYFPNRSHSNARIAANLSSANIVSTNHTLFLLSNDQLLPTFYSTDSNTTLLNNGETYVGFTLLVGAKPEHSNYYRI